MKTNDYLDQKLVLLKVKLLVETLELFTLVGILWMLVELAR